MANEYLQRTPTSTGNRRVWTWAGWYKRNDTTTDQLLFGEAATSSHSDTNVLQIRLSGGNNILVIGWSGSFYQSVPIYRDSGSWLHILVSQNTSLSTATERIQVYVNGVKIIGTYPIGNPGVNTELGINMTNRHTIGVNGYLATPSASFLNGEIADFFLVDGQALTPDVFGFYKPGKGYISAGSTQATDFRNGQWVPRKPSSIIQEINDEGGFGVNGFYLPMNDSTNFGADFHCDPNSIITLNEKLSQPRVGVANSATAGIGFTDALRADPYAANLVLALPFVSSGLSSGFGDYAPSIKGSGSVKTLTNTTAVSIATTAGYYGSAANFGGSHYLTASYNSDFNFGTGDFTVEMWVYPTAVSDIRGLFAVSGGSGGVPKMVFHLNSGTPSVHYNGLTNASDIYTAASSAIPANQWTHLAYVRKGTTWTWFANGVATGTGTNTTVITFTTQPYYVGYGGEGYFVAFNGYLQDLRIYKGVAKYTTGFDVPKPYTPVGIATWRAVPDTCQNNFATLNPLVPSVFSSGDRSISNGNLTVTTITTGNATNARSTIGVSTGRWYAETYLSGDTNAGGGFLSVLGIGRTDNQNTQASGDHVNYYGANGYRYDYVNGSATVYPYGSSYTTGDIVGISINADNGEIIFYKNGVSQGVAKTFPSSQYPLFIQMEDGASSNTVTFNMNFGQNPTFSGNVSVGGTFTDSNGKGLFKYQPPTGFLALCEDNLPKPTIEDPGKYFKTVLFRADGNVRGITGVGFKPDLVWFKYRNFADNHVLVDSVRGAGKRIFSDLSNAEIDAPTSLTSFDNDGFSIGTHGSINTNGRDVVVWCWKAGGAAVVNTNGSLSSQVSANQTSGFSIVSYTGNGTNPTTVGHGLRKAPKFIILKCRNTAVNWYVYHGFNSSGAFEGLNTTSAFNSAATLFNQTAPTDTIINLGSGDSNTNGRTYIAYCWTEIEGFSRFGSYIGNGSADGPFVYCGFKPAWILIRNSSDTTHWIIYDSVRNSTNLVYSRLAANISDFENQSDAYLGTSPSIGVDFLSNGFKIRITGPNHNNSGNTYVFAAFAESPFQTANSK